MSFVIYSLPAFLSFLFIWNKLQQAINCWLRQVYSTFLSLQTTVSLTWDAKEAAKMWRALLFMNHFFTTTSTVKNQKTQNMIYSKLPHHFFTTMQNVKNNNISDGKTDLVSGSRELWTFVFVNINNNIDTNPLLVKSTNNFGNVEQRRFQWIKKMFVISSFLWGRKKWVVSLSQGSF